MSHLGYYLFSPETNMVEWNFLFISSLNTLYLDSIYSPKSSKHEQIRFYIYIASSNWTKVAMVLVIWFHCMKQNNE